MYREPDYSHLERELDNLSRDEINHLEIELSSLYGNPRLRQLQNKDSILELEQRLLVARKRKQYLNDKLKIADEVVQLEHNVRKGKFFTSAGTFFICPLFGAISLFSLAGDSIESYFLLGVGVTGTLCSIIATGMSYKYKKEDSAKLKGLKESKEYNSLIESTEYKALLSLEFVKALP